MSRKRRLALLTLLISYGGTLGTEQVTCIPQTGTVQPRKPTSFRKDAKCVFLREESRRIQMEGADWANGSRFTDSIGIPQLESLGATIEELAESVATSEEFAAKLTVLGLRSASCVKGEDLSSLDRLMPVDGARQKHIVRVKTRWERLGGTESDPQARTIFEKVNAVYDAEARSFYNSDRVREVMDPDIIKDYPDLLFLIEGSALETEQKRFLRENSRHLRYEEAGRLFNVLNGLDPNGSLSYAYALRKVLVERAKEESATAQAEAAKQAEEASRTKEDVMTWVWIGGLVLLLAGIGLMVFLQSKKYARYKAIRDGVLIMPYRWGTRQLILWEPGEAVVIQREKRMVPMADPAGGYTSISTWAGEEYKGRISYKVQFMTWTSDPIYTSDGVLVNLTLDIWWLIQNPNLYVERISADYHAEDKHHGEQRGYTDIPKGEKQFDRKLTETAEKWIRSLAGSTLREHICRLTSAKLISPYVQGYINRHFQAGATDGKQDPNELPTLLDNAGVALDRETMKDGIHIERLEVRELKLPQHVQDKLEGVRVTFLEAPQSEAQTEAGAIAIKGLGAAQVAALEGLAKVIGEHRVGQIELLKAFGMAKIPFVAPHAPALSLMQPITSIYQDSIQGIIPGPNDLPSGAATKIAETTQEAEKQSDAEPPKSQGTAAGGK